MVKYQINIIYKKIINKWIKFRLKPIRVFCLHHVCAKYDVKSMHQCDWIDISVFKQKILELKNHGYHFISLTKAYFYMRHDYIRFKKYAVLTFDDGYDSLKEILPWLIENEIPTTLFINGKYLDGSSYRETDYEKYLSYEDLFALTSPLIEIGNHGWEHISVHKMTNKDFYESVKLNTSILHGHPRYVSFWAYTWGDNNENSNSILRKKNLIPLMMTGMKNYKFDKYINRELL